MNKSTRIILCILFGLGFLATYHIVKPRYDYTGINSTISVKALDLLRKAEFGYEDDNITILRMDTDTATVTYNVRSHKSSIEGIKQGKKVDDALEGLRGMFIPMAGAMFLLAALSIFGAIKERE